jgi:broad specificity phosphatase PhoE
MNRPALLVLVRHGESLRNVAKTGNVFFADDESRRSVRGVADHQIPLTEEGLRQARETGSALAEQFGSFDAVYHSGYRRTRETAVALLEGFADSVRARMQTRQSLFIRERDTGYAYDMTTTEAEVAFPYLDEYWKTSGSFFARPPGGESIAQVVERVHSFMDILIRDHAGERVLVVTHGGTLRAFRFLLEHWSYEQAESSMRTDPPHNCGATSYVYNEAERRLTLHAYDRVLWATRR